MTANGGAVQSGSGVGFALALTSAASFGISGMIASALIDAGWSAGAVTTTRIVAAALLMLVPALIAVRGAWGSVRRGAGQIVLFGVFAVALCQLAFFSAVQFIPPALALLIEFLGPVLLVAWTWARTRRSPGATTLVGVAVAVLGLALVSGVGAGALHPLGVLLALGSAVGNAVYWASAASDTHGLPPVTLAAFGLGVGGVLLAGASALGVLPFTATGAPVTLAGAAVPMPVAVAVLVLVATVAAYVLGIAGARRLGARVASFVGYSEPLFGIVWMALLLALWPSPLQWIGGAAIVVGVVVVRLGEQRKARIQAPSLPLAT